MFKETASSNDVDMPPSLFVIIPGFGRPNADIKNQILSLNLSKICSYKWDKLKIRICAYDDTSLTLSTDYDEHVEIMRTPGVPGDFLKAFATADDVAAYDYVLILYDDILLLPNLDIGKMIELKEFFRLDVMSPSLSLDSEHVYKYMLTNPNGGYDLKITPCCELFCYLINREAYKKYYEHIDCQNNPWLWGLDLIVGCKIGLRIGIMNTMNMKHFFALTCYKNCPDRDPQEGFNFTLKKYDVTVEQLAQQPEALFYIKQSSHILSMDDTCNQSTQNLKK